MKEKLEEYKKKRDFEKTNEPEDHAGKEDERIFVVQKHYATNLHYDFRISLDGVLKSWAIPKGPSLDPGIKRLAIQTEDHPLSYADFEGKIPEGQYGAGKVIVWDKGKFENMKQNKDLASALYEGHITLKLNGKKLKGGFAITRINDKKKQWLLVKMKDDFASSEEIVKHLPESVISNKTIEEI